MSSYDFIINLVNRSLNGLGQLRANSRDKDMFDTNIWY